MYHRDMSHNAWQKVLHMDAMYATILMNPSNRTEMPNRKIVEMYRHWDSRHDQDEIVRARILTHGEIRVWPVSRRLNIHNQVAINSELARSTEHHIDFLFSNELTPPSLSKFPPMRSTPGVDYIARFENMPRISSTAGTFSNKWPASLFAFMVLCYYDTISKSRIRCGHNIFVDFEHMDARRILIHIIHYISTSGYNFLL